MGKDNMTSKITEIRTFLMGVAILCIMVFHTTDIFVVPIFMASIQKTGYLGVDIFFFVSSYGLYYSMQKTTSLKEWYLRRLKRILPTFWLISITMGLVKGWSLYEHLREETFFGFFLPWTNRDVYYDVIFWYIPAALLFYLLFPLFYKYRRLILLGYIPIVILSYAVSTIVSSFLGSRGWAPYIPGFLGRIPVFILGLIVAEYEDKIREKLSVSSTALLVLVSFLCFVLLECQAMDILKVLSFPCHDFFFMACSLPFICWACSLLQKYVKIPNPFILYCGKYSLELYLLHVAFVSIVISRPELFSSINSNYSFGGAFLLSFPLAWVLHNGIDKIITKCSSIQ